VEVVVDDDGRTGSIGIRGRAETGSDGGRAGIVKSAWDVCSPQAAISVVSPVITINRRCIVRLLKAATEILMDYEQGNC